MMTEQLALPDIAAGFPPDLLADVVDTFKALSDPTRAQLLFLLTEHEYSVNELSACVAVSASAVSHHLTKLRAIRLVRTRRSGNQIYYSVDDSHVAALFQEALYHLDHVRRHRHDHLAYRKERRSLPYDPADRTARS